MDPLSQAVTGAALAGIFSKRKTMRPALILGAMAGMAPDLDVFIRSEADPLLALEYHRHFTHSLAFSPLGGLLCAGFFWLFPWFKNQLIFWKIYLFCFLGLFTHGLLDACTGYGTHVLWPFSNARESWNFIGIIDLAYTLPALVLLIVAHIKSSRVLSSIAMLWMLAYLSLGAWQHHRATAITEQWLEKQNIAHHKLTLRPTIGNLWLWRIIYEDTKTHRWQTHALYLPYWSDAVGIRRGETAKVFDDKMLAAYPEDTVTGADIRRFQFFSDGYLSHHKQDDGGFIIGDIRYSMTPDGAEPLWGIEPSKKAEEHVTRHSALNRDARWKNISDLLGGEGFEPLN